MQFTDVVSPLAGRTDFFLAPELEAGNTMNKQLQYSVDADSTGNMMGACVPLLLTCQFDSAGQGRAWVVDIGLLIETRRPGRGDQS